MCPKPTGGFIFSNSQAGRGGGGGNQKKSTISVTHENYMKFTFQCPRNKVLLEHRHTCPMGVLCANFWATMTEYSWGRDRRAWETENIYNLALFRKTLSTPEQTTKKVKNIIITEARTIAPTARGLGHEPERHVEGGVQAGSALGGGCKGVHFTVFKLFLWFL